MKKKCSILLFCHIPLYHGTMSRDYPTLNFLRQFVIESASPCVVDVLPEWNAVLPKLVVYLAVTTAEYQPFVLMACNVLRCASDQVNLPAHGCAFHSEGRRAVRVVGRLDAVCIVGDPLASVRQCFQFFEPVRILFAEVHRRQEDFLREIILAVRLWSSDLGHFVSSSRIL